MGDERRGTTLSDRFDTFRDDMDKAISAARSEYYRAAVDASLLSLKEAGVSYKEISIILRKVTGEAVPPERIGARIVCARRRTFTP